MIVFHCMYFVSTITTLTLNRPTNFKLLLPYMESNHVLHLLASSAAILFDTSIYFQDAVLKANARTKKWIVYSVVFGSIAVMGIAAILVGLYVSGNLQKNAPQEVSRHTNTW